MIPEQGNLQTWLMAQNAKMLRNFSKPCNLPVWSKDTHQVVAVWSPSPVQEDFQSAADFHTLLLPPCISSVRQSERGRTAKRERQEREREGLFNPDRRVKCVLWFYLDRHKESQDLLTLVMTSQTHTHGGGSGWERTGQIQHVWQLQVCVRAHGCTCVSTAVHA